MESLPKRKEWPQRHKVISWQGRQNRFAKEKTNGAISPDHQIVEWQRVKMSESLTLAKIRMVRVGASRGKSQLQSVVRWVLPRRVGARKKNLPMRSRRTHERMS